jgi:hypothetical protein
MEIDRLAGPVVAFDGPLVRRPRNGEAVVDFDAIRLIWHI